MCSRTEVIERLAKNEKISIAKLATEIGKPAANLYDIQSGKIKGVSDKLAKLITKRYPKYSYTWLLTGEGNMLVDEEEAKPEISYKKGRPYYNVDFVGGFDLVGNDQTTNPEYLINFAPYNKDGIIWCNLSGNSMYPTISNGDMIAIKELADWSIIEYGAIYGVVTNTDLRTIKIVRKGKDDKHIRLIPVNTKDFDEVEIDLSSVQKMYRVVGCVKML